MARRQATKTTLLGDSSNPLTQQGVEKGSFGIEIKDGSSENPLAFKDCQQGSHDEAEKASKQEQALAGGDVEKQASLVVVPVKDSCVMKTLGEAEMCEFMCSNN